MRHIFSKEYTTLVVFFLFSINSLFAQISFAPSEFIETYGDLGDWPSATYQDFDEDGKQDVMFFRDYEIIIRYGNGDGTFGEDNIIYTQTDKKIYAISNPYDINDDGYFDLAIISYQSIRILEGSKGEMTKSIQAPFNSYYGRLIWMDFNQDGHVDLVTEDNVSIIANFNWEEDLSNFQRIINTTGSPFTFEIEDVNQDSRLDFCVSSTTRLSVFLQTSSGSYNEILVKNEGTLRFEVGDVSLDGYLDLVYSKDNEIYSQIYDNNSQSFTENHLTSSEDHYNLSRIDLADIDQNNSLDIIFGNGMGAVSYLKNSGGTFQSTVDILDHGVSSYVYGSLLVQDINDDDQNDILVHGISNQEVHLLEDDLEVLESKYNALNPDTQDLDFEDLDSDGYADLLSLSEHGEIVVYWGDETYSFEETSRFATTNHSKISFIHDIDSDGINDIIYSRETPNNGYNGLYLMSGLGNRKFSSPEPWKYMPDPSDAMAVDMNNDAKEEVLFFNKYSSDIVWFEPGNTDYSEYFDTTNKISIDDGSGIVDLTTGDWNADGRTDIATANSSADISILINNGGSFSESTIEVGRGMLAIEQFDYNDDERPDILAITQDNGEYALEVFIRKSDGSYKGSDQFDLDMYQPGNIDILDLDSDGDEDIVVGRYDYSVNIVLENNNYSFLVYNDHNLDSEYQEERVYADINNDGKIDVLGRDYHNGDFYKKINNSVDQAEVNGLKVSVTEVTDNEAALTISDKDNDGWLVVLSESSSLSDIPQDGYYYASNSQFGLGTSFDEDGFVVHRGEDANVDIQGLEGETKYFAYVFPFRQNSPQNSIINYSSEYVRAQFTTEEQVITGLPSDPILEGISLWPNPASDSFLLKFSELQKEPVELMIFNPSGMLVYDHGNLMVSNSNNLKVNVPGLTSGLYYVRINTSQTMVALPLMIK